MTRSCLALLSAAILALPSLAAEPDKDGFVPLFNGKDLSGWVNVNCHPSTFFVKDNEIITTGKPTGFLRTEKQYENFIIDFDWMHVNKKEVGNSGLFVWGDPIPATGTGYTRGIEVQVLVNLEYKDKKSGKVTATSHGDLFSIWGATCKPDRPHPLGWSRCLPSEYNAKGGGEWNHYKVTAKDGVLKLEVNGKEVSGVSECKPRKGYLALESEGAECHFKNIKIKELPSTNPKPEECADVDKGFKNLYFGDLTGWTVSDDDKANWKPKDWVLAHQTDKLAPGELYSSREYTDFELITDFKLSAAKRDLRNTFSYYLRSPGGVRVALGTKENGLTVRHGNGTKGGGGAAKNAKLGQWNRLLIRVKGDQISVWVNGTPQFEDEKLEAKVLKKGKIVLQVDGNVDFANMFVRELK